MSVGVRGFCLGALLALVPTVSAENLGVQADFSAGDLQSYPGDSISFSDLSTGIVTSWFWEFGDGETSSFRFVSHEYESPGTYTVSLTVSGPNGSDTETKPDYITIHNLDFAGSPRVGETPLTVQFVSLAGGDPSSWFWNFGDGNFTTQQHPQHTYTSPGIYSVSHSATIGIGGHGSVSKHNYIRVGRCNVTTTSNFTGNARELCLCFIPGEQAGATFHLPQEDYPVSVNEVRFSFFSLEGGCSFDKVHGLRMSLYEGALPDPGVALTWSSIDNFPCQTPLNPEFPGTNLFQVGPVTVTLTFGVTNVGAPDIPSLAHDNNGCVPGRNVIYTIPDNSEDGVWVDACDLGLGGNWVIEIDYRLLAKAKPANGNGVNPITLTTPGPPVFGQPWIADLDCSGHANDIAYLVGHRAPAANPIATVFGEVLVNLGSPRPLLSLQPHGGGVVTFTNNIPNMVGLCGYELYVQGLCLGAPIGQFSNRLDLRVGDM